MKFLKRKRQKNIPVSQCEGGATAIEYALIIGLIALAILGAMAAFTDSIENLFEAVTRVAEEEQSS